MHNFLYSLLSFILALFFVLIGVICIIIPWSIEIRATLIEFILEYSVTLSLFGLAFVIIGLAIISNIIINAKRYSYVVKSGANGFTVDETVIQQYLKLYWKQLFPKNDIPTRLSIKNNKIHIAIELPYMPLEEQRPLLERVKDDLCLIFADKLGYRKDFSFAASFQAQPKNLTSS